MHLHTTEYVCGNLHWALDDVTMATHQRMCAVELMEIYYGAHASPWFCTEDE